MTRRFLGAVQYLTIVPVRTRTAEPGQSAVFFPLVAALLGGAGGLVLEYGRGYLPFTLLVLLVLVLWAIITGGRNENAFAGVGARGPIAVVLLSLIRWQALSAITIDAVWALAAALALGQGAVIALAWIATPAPDGSAARLTASLTTPIALLAIAQAVCIVLVPGGRTASLLLGGATAIALAARSYCTGRIGGITGESLAATGQIVETWCFLVYSCPPCTS